MAAQGTIVKSNNGKTFDLKDARKEIGLGMPPECFGDGASALAQFCSPEARVPVAEVARWVVNLPISDDDIKATFGNRINVWGTPDGQAPRGVTDSSNTLGTPGMFADDMVLIGLRVRVLVEPEARLIKGALFNPGSSSSLPGIPDDWTWNDILQNIFGFAQGQGELLPAELIYGMATWKAAYSFMNAYELFVGKSHSDAIFKQPMTQTGHVEPFAGAEAAGMSYGSNQDRINELNQRLSAILPSPAFQFAPAMFKRLGMLTVLGQPVSNVSPSREEDGDISMFGGIGVPMDLIVEPMRFALPVFWPAGKSMIIEFQVSSASQQADFQRWMSVTGGSNGTPGQDLNLPYSQAIASGGGYTGLSPTTTGATTMPEQTLDTPPATVTTNQVQANRAILKAGRMIWEVAPVGYRVGQPAWGPYVAAAISRGEIIAPHGLGSIAAYMK